eukprot:TRINITY_DN83704_c0_g1_i1.p2 TRINITY_DN83704_c0_g1~~TRINITY_DN83704_c0_g1_i1.p2  ORF type:complete len:217 (+),score=28.82 TRINITY_DN83704_c0_g1_i1:89-739(+)
MSNVITLDPGLRGTERRGPPGTAYERHQRLAPSGAAFAHAEALRSRTLNLSRSQPCFASSMVTDHGATWDHGGSRGRNPHSTGRSTIVAAAAGMDPATVAKWSDSIIRGRPPNDGMRAAGQPSGGPCKRDYLMKFERSAFQDEKGTAPGSHGRSWQKSGTPVEGRVRADTKGLTQHQMTRARWQTMKYDPNWYNHSDILRPHAASDLTGFPKLYFG